MKLRRPPSVILPLAGAVLLAGCSTYGAPPPSIVYVPAPCDAPGAVRVVTVAPPPGPGPAGPAGGAPAVPPSPVAGAADGSSPPGGGRCLVAVAAGRGGYPYRYGYPATYGAPFYGSLGFGIGIGGHHVRGSHLGAGHAGGHHGGGHH